MFRDIEINPASNHGFGSGRNVIAVVGIDRYRRWPRLSNAVNDARGALNAFLQLGFQQVTEPLYEEVATADAIRRLVTDDLARLNEDDSLVLFFAGHGHTITQTFPDGDSRKTGYIIPVDGDEPGASTGRWLRLDHWLSDISLLKVKHILVFLDACHSGIALGSLVKWRDSDQRSESFKLLAQRRSRRVITSALDDQRAMDSGPMPRHSLFTGCLLEGLDGGIAARGERITGSQIGLYLQKRVTSYPRSVQTPDFGALEEDRRGELVIQLPPPEVAEPAPPPAPANEMNHGPAAPEKNRPVDELALAEGAQIGSYRIERQLGRGGFGVVYVGLDVRLGRRAAIKRLLPARSDNREIVERFFNEAKAAASINHPGIVEIYDVGWHTDGSAYFAMKLLEGESLARRLRARGAMPVLRAATIGRQIASALGAAHAAGIVHRDLKPDNIILAPDEETAIAERAIVLDFGIAKLCGEEAPNRTRAGMLLGTPLYMSPEQCHGSLSVDHRTDVYALGCILFEMLSGRPPFVGDGAGAVLGMHQFVRPPLLRSLRPGLPADIEAVVMHALGKRPDERFQHMSELAAALQPFAAARPVDPIAPSDSAPAAVSTASVVVSECAYTPEPRMAESGASSQGAHGPVAVARALSTVSEACGVIVSAPEVSDRRDVVAVAPHTPTQPRLEPDAVPVTRVTARMEVPHLPTPLPLRRTRWWVGLSALMVAGGMAAGVRALAVRNGIVPDDENAPATLERVVSTSGKSGAQTPPGHRAEDETCEPGRPGACARLGLAYETGHGKDRSFELALAAYLRGCDAGLGDACAGLGRLYGNGNGVRLEPARALAMNQKACQLRSAQGCTQTGMMYDSGLGAPVDHAKALANYQVACDLGNASGCSNAGLTWTYWRSAGPTDPEKGKRFYRRARERGTLACDAGDLFACDALGTLYADGRDVEADASRALVLFQRACELGNPGSCVRLGGMYDSGIGIPLDRARARALFQMACEGGDNDGCSRVGMIYLRGLGVDKDVKRGIALLDDACLKGVCGDRVAAYLEGLGGPIDKVKALETAQQGCDAGDSESCSYVGYLVPERKVEIYQRICDTGSSVACLELGIARWNAGDNKQAVEFFEQSCGMSAGSFGCCWLGAAYMDGKGVNKDEKRGVALCDSACNRGDGSSCNELAELYTSGHHVQANPRRAADMLDKACVLRLGEACRLLADRYASGDGVPRDPERAAELRQAACINGDKASCKK